MIEGSLGNVRLGRFLRVKRMECGLTQADVAEKVGLSSGQYLSNVERGCCCISLKCLRKLVALYGFPVEEVLSLMLELERESLWKALGQNSVGCVEL